ncbi:unnamed protein product [Mytilus edulis]|uniref:Integrase catalytic domain-containing protein n=1 Tax=Mytilus edulis TaxID=6550 RepID=A0A8S3S4Z5_MYTED|nr:unnamed protein product [Mytilus edulis]
MGPKKLDKPQQRYSVTRRELLAVITFIHQFRHYLVGRKFLLRSDHASLRWLFNFKDPQGQLARWLETLSQYNFDIQHRPGVKHQNADSLSRREYDLSLCDHIKQGVRSPECKNCISMDADWVDFKTDVDNVTNLSDNPFVSKICAVTRSQNSKLIDSNWLSGYTTKELENFQKEDSDLGPVHKWLDNNCKPNRDEIASYSPSTRKYWLNYDLLITKNNVLYQKRLQPTGESYQLLVPKVLRKEVMTSCHNTMYSAHFGVNKTKEKIKNCFHWYKMGEDIQSHVNTCSVCNRFKALNRKPKASLQSYTVEVCKLLEIHKTRSTSYRPCSNGIIERFNATLEGMIRSFVNKNANDWDLHIGILMAAYRSTVHPATGKPGTIPLQHLSLPGNTRRNMDRHILSYKPHLDKLEELGIQSNNSNCIIKSTNPYFVKLGIDTSCDATYKDQSYIVTEVVESIIEIREDSGEFNITDNSCQTEETFITFRELKAEVNVMKGSHQAELNRFGDYIARLENRLKMKEEEVKLAERKLRKDEEGSRMQLKEKDDLIRKLERKLRHKDNEVEVLRRKLRVDEFDSEEEKENERPRKKLKGYVVKNCFRQYLDFYLNVIFMYLLCLLTKLVSVIFTKI